MEFLRFGSSIPGTYWGCCAIDIIQNFNRDPDEKSSIQIVDGDGGCPITNSKGFMFAGPTYRDIFLQRLRYGTFGTGDMPNHGFIAVLTINQVNSTSGKKWLKLLKENGFEFLRTVDNSVYTGPKVIDSPGGRTKNSHENYVFGLFRNIGAGAVKDPFTPPKAWTDLPEVVPELWQYLGQGADNLDGESLNKKVQASQLPLYNSLPKGQFMSEEELNEAKVPVVYAGLRSRFPQETVGERKRKVEGGNKKSITTSGGTAAPFAATLPPVSSEDYDEDFEDFEDFEEDCDCDLCCPK